MHRIISLNHLFTKVVVSAEHKLHHAGSELRISTRKFCIPRTTPLRCNQQTPQRVQTVRC